MELQAEHQHLVNELQRICLSLFRKNMFGIFHGSISARIELNKFIINRADTIFDTVAKEDFVLLYHNRDYRWKEASIDAGIHSQMYSLFADAKYIAYAMPPYVMSYVMHHDVIIPKDYFGNKAFSKVEVYTPKNLDNWYDRAETEITKYFEKNKTHIMVIRGYGIYVHSRNLYELAKLIAILENSCRILLLSSIGTIAEENLY
jgi:L-fuculose-phosphate aldolase